MAQPDITPAQQAMLRDWVQQEVHRRIAENNQPLGSQHGLQNISGLNALVSAYHSPQKSGSCSEWITQLEAALTLSGSNTCSNEVAITYASLRLKGAAKDWYLTVKAKTKDWTWLQFKNHMLAHFEPHNVVTEAQLASICQGEDQELQDYWTVFQLLGNKCFADVDLKEWPQRVYYQFTSGMWNTADRYKVLDLVHAGSTFSEAIETVIELEKHLAAFCMPSILPAAPVYQPNEGPATKQVARKKSNLTQSQPADSALEDINSRLADLMLTVSDNTISS